MRQRWGRALGWSPRGRVTWRRGRGGPFRAVFTAPLTPLLVDVAFLVRAVGLVLELASRVGVEEKLWAEVWLGHFRSG